MRFGGALRTERPSRCVPIELLLDGDIADFVILARREARPELERATEASLDIALELGWMSSSSLDGGACPGVRGYASRVVTPMIPDFGPLVSA